MSKQHPRSVELIIEPKVKDLGEFTVKGVSEPVSVHELRGMSELRTRFDVSRARGLSRFVGRATDMQTLESALEQSRQGRQYERFHSWHYSDQYDEVMATYHQQDY